MILISRMRKLYNMYVSKVWIKSINIIYNIILNIILLKHEDLYV